MKKFLGERMKKYLFLMNYMVKVRDDKSSAEYRLVQSSRTIRATSFKEARDKLRKAVSYDVTAIDVALIRQTLPSRILSFFRKKEK